MRVGLFLLQSWCVTAISPQHLTFAAARSGGRNSILFWSDWGQGFLAGWLAATDSVSPRQRELDLVLSSPSFSSHIRLIASSLSIRFWRRSDEKFGCYPSDFLFFFFQYYHYVICVCSIKETLNEGEREKGLYSFNVSAQIFFCFLYFSKSISFILFYFIFLVLLLLLLSFLFLSSRKFNTPTDFVAEFVRFLCFKSDFIWPVFFSSLLRVDATQKKTHGRDSERAPSSGTRSRHIQNERAKRSQPKTDTTILVYVSVCVCLLVFILL